MLGAIAGDILGSRFEGHPGPSRGFDLFHPDCRFTDDTVCALAVAAALPDGSDTDTLACITGAVAEVAHGLPVEIGAGARAHLTPDLSAVLERFEQQVQQSPAPGLVW
jgi:ADP-ribosylglycohydrolase